MLKRLFGGQQAAPAPQARTRHQGFALATAETDDTITLGARAHDGQYRTRIDYDRAKVLDEVITAWRSNPIAKRIIEITTEFVLGDGLTFNCDHEKSQTFLKAFWSHPLNNMEQMLVELADEAWRTGDLFILFSWDAAGMVYVRAIPAELITEIKTADNDIRQELAYLRSPLDDKTPYISRQQWEMEGQPKEKSFVLHFPLSRAVGSSFGESDLAAVLYWIKLYRQFLEDRARLNYFRQLFSFIVQKSFNSLNDKIKYALDFVARLPKKSGGVLVVDKDETIGTLNPNLGSSDAELDGLALKKMIATGVQMPLHYMAEPESSTRTTAEAAGTPTFRRFKRRQAYLIFVTQSILQTALMIRSLHDSTVKANAEIIIRAPDITERDNAITGMAAKRIVDAMSPLFDADKISATELVRVVYRMLGEPIPIDHTPNPTIKVMQKITSEPSQPDDDDEEEAEMRKEIG